MITSLVISVAPWIDDSLSCPDPVSAVVLPQRRAWRSLEWIASFAYTEDGGDSYTGGVILWRGRNAARLLWSCSLPQTIWKLQRNRGLLTNH